MSDKLYALFGVMFSISLFGGICLVAIWLERQCRWIFDGRMEQDRAQRLAGPFTQTITLIVDDDDYRDIVAAVKRRRSWEVMPEGGGNPTGRAVGEICRGWMEMHDFASEKDAERAR